MDSKNNCPSPNSSNMESYILTAQKRKQRDIARKQERWQRGQEIARKAAEFLKRDYGAVEVILFGSAVECDRFTLTSDLDLAAKGLPVEKFFAAVAQLQDFSPEFKIDLVELERCRESLRQVILTEGRHL
jgi:predicted nucleotidyltransferase